MRARPSSRLLIVDAEGRTLLFRFQFDRGALAGQRFWATAGGGLDPGETYEQGAVRELFEETGLCIADPGPQVARRIATFRMPSGEMIEADERYFLVRTHQLDVSTAGRTALEREVMTAHRWLSHAELAAMDEQVWPEDLAAILIACGAWT